MREAGVMVKQMDWDSTYFKTDLLSLPPGLIIAPKERLLLHTLTETYSKVFGRTVRPMGLGFTYIRMDNPMQVVMFCHERSMERGSSTWKREINLLRRKCI